MTTIPDLKELLARATKGDWKHYHAKLRSNFGGVVDEVQGPNDEPIATWSGFDQARQRPQQKAANAKLMSLAPTLAQRVIDQDAEIERLRANEAGAVAAIEAGCQIQDLYRHAAEAAESKLKQIREIAIKVEPITLDTFETRAQKAEAYLSQIATIAKGE